MAGVARSGRGVAAARTAAAAVFTLLAVAACAPAPDSGPQSPPTPAISASSAASTPTGELGRPGCSPASPIRSSPELGPETRGTPSGPVELWGLLMSGSDGPPFHAGAEVKIVWRMTGSGPLQLTLTDPQGRDRPLQWGPEGHGGSNYQRPGEEWGAGYLFDASGCWRLHAQRNQDAADVWLSIAAA